MVSRSRILWIVSAVALVVAGIAALPSSGSAAAPAPRGVHVDFTAAGPGDLDRDFFVGDGLRLADDGVVAFIQGDDALVSPTGIHLLPPAVEAVQVRLAPAMQGTARYVLTAWGPDRRHALARTERVVTQDEGDAASAPFGYFTMELGLPATARFVTIECQFIRSSFRHITSMEFGVSDVTYQATRQEASSRR